MLRHVVTSCKASWCDFAGKFVSLSYVDNAMDTPWLSCRKFTSNVRLDSM